MLIVGGGPVDLTTSILLLHQGIRSVLVEQWGQVSWLPCDILTRYVRAVIL